MEATLPAEFRDPAFDLPEVRRVQPRVDAAAEKLLERGLQPTVERVRVEIGGGSPNAVAPALRHWRLRRDRALGRAPDAVPSPVLDAARNLYQVALDTAARATGTSTAELAAQLEAERAKTAALTAELTHARRELDTLRTERAWLFEAAGHTHSELVQMQALAAHCVAEQSATQRRLDLSQKELGTARAQVAAIEAKLLGTRPRSGSRAARTTKATSNGVRKKAKAPRKTKTRGSAPNRQRTRRRT
jgi:hypothetical protein